MTNPDGPQTVLVTGGYGALGGAIATHAEKQGAVVVRTGRHPEADGLTLDVTDAASWAAAFDEVASLHGGVDVLVNAAGALGGTEQTLHSATSSQWHEIIDTHVVGAWLGCREIASRPRTRPGAVVNISSTAGLNATPGMIAYGAAKAAVAHLTTSVALAYARAGLDLRCNAVAPALVDGGVRDDVLATIAPDREKALAGYLGRVPVGALVAPEEVARTVWFLATETHPSLTGQVVPLAGGLGLA